MSIVSAKNFTFNYPATEKATIEGISFEIKQGEVIGIIGPLAAGKTTLCMAIADFAPRIVGGDFEGSLRVDNRKLGSDNRKQDRQVGMVFEDYSAQLVQIKVLDEVTTPLLNHGKSPEDANNRARELLEKVGLGTGEKIEKTRIWQLSGGQQQRLAIAATLAIEPQILILDSVIDKLDSSGQAQVKSIVSEFCGDRTQIIVEQDIDILVQCADRILVLIDGEIVAEGKPEEILQNEELLSRADIDIPVSLRVAKALGLSEMPLTPEDFPQDKFTNRNSNQNSNQNLQNQNYSSSYITIEPRSYKQKQEQEPEPENKKSTNFGQALVKVENLSYSYSDENQALEDIDIEIREGEIHALIGHSGAGKTTVVKHIAGLLSPSIGKVTVCDIDIDQKTVPELGLTIGTVFQNPDEQISEKTVREEIAFPLKQRQYQRKGLFSREKNYEDDHITEQLSRVCELVGIDEKILDKDPILLSRGQRKLVTIAAALIVDPKVLILDEPTVGLSASSRRQIAELLTKVCEKGKAVLLVSNNIDFVCEVADTVTVLKQGKIQLQSPINEAFAADNWERLEEMDVHLPAAARLAKRLGINAFTCDELISKLVVSC
ncbi:ABC transporter ATP-binding protein [Calothrix sp. CCY 0018]|uniref:ABC transporter ATP-binding protein n=1 Tax=Calothrix sp. CCY 0018 TaxID=3103864 RepID=UPI0039C613A3